MDPTALVATVLDLTTRIVSGRCEGKTCRITRTPKPKNPEAARVWDLGFGQVEELRDSGSNREPSGSPPKGW